MLPKSLQGTQAQGQEKEMVALALEWAQVKVDRKSHLLRNHHKHHLWEHPQSSSTNTLCFHEPRCNQHSHLLTHTCHSNRLHCS
jgi:hypothetical protein